MEILFLNASPVRYDTQYRVCFKVSLGDREFLEKSTRGSECFCGSGGFVLKRYFRGFSKKNDDGFYFYLFVNLYFQENCF